MPAAVAMEATLLSPKPSRPTTEVVPTMADGITSQRLHFDVEAQRSSPQFISLEFLTEMRFLFEHLRQRA